MFQEVKRFAKAQKPR